MAVCCHRFTIKMTIEEAIKQTKKFRNEYERVAVNIAFTSNWLSDQFQSYLKQYGISQQQYNILRILRGQHPNPASVNLLKERMIDKNSDVSRMIDRLLAKELVIRNTCPDDRRSVNIFISEKGLSILSEIDQDSGKQEHIIKGITEEEAKQLNELLDKIRTV